MKTLSRLTAAVIGLLGLALAATAAEPQQLPWQREIPLKEAAKAVNIDGQLSPQNGGRGGGSMSINNLKMHTIIWGPSNRITISINKNNVWDRRLHEIHAPTIEELTEGAFSPNNQDYIGVKEADNITVVTVDIVDLPSLAKRLSAKADPVSAYISTRLDDKAKAALDAYLAGKGDARQLKLALLSSLAASLNAIVHGASIYDQARFQGIPLRPGTAQLVRGGAGQDAGALNRALLEDAYPELSKRPGNSHRPFDLGWLDKDRGTLDEYRYPMRYAFPCLKPVGQIILGIDDMAGAAAPRVSQSCANGMTHVEAANGAAKANVDYLLEMAKDVYAIRGTFSGLKAPLSLRLYRHRDTSHLAYMTEDGKYTNPAAEKDKAFNFPIDPPTSGTDGRYFWIRQKMPAEKTFPQGFEYVLMGVVKGDAKLESVQGKTGLGTPPADSPMPWDWFGAPRPSIAKAPGAAATATLTPGADGKLEAFVTVVTSMDGPDLVAEAKKRLAAAEAAGFDGAVAENTKWWNDFYDKRENGRVFTSTTGTACTENVRGVFGSWSDSHGGGTKTDMRQLECSASYAVPEADIQNFDGAPCYNEIFYTSRFVQNRGDSEDMWKQIIQYWMPGGKQNARDRFHMPGTLLTHGYLPPVKPDKYVHSTIALELCLETMAQLFRPAWDEWDYGGDVKYLKEECYPMMKEMALFYAAYPKKGADGYLHIAPTMEPERWGIYPKFSRNTDIVASLCMFRWALIRAADSADLLKVDADLAKQWREVAAHLAPNPTWKKPNGLIYAVMPGVEPVRMGRDHQEECQAYLVSLADEINLDSPQEQKDMMFRTMQAVPAGESVGFVNRLLAAPAGAGGAGKRGGGGGGGGGYGGGMDAETLLNSRSGRIHLFPVVAPGAVVAFHNFQASGGYLVSAARNASGVYYLEIEPRRDNTCRVMNPWPGKTVAVHEVGKTEPVKVDLDKTNGECLAFATVAGHKYLVEAK